jgi:phospholipid/cholesterol/gamma-HCH transport system substrate-binding protein
MERQANYAFVGLMTLVIFIAFFGFAFWMIRSDFNQEYKTYDVVFEKPVNGLTKGGEVHFNGIKVGEVTALKLSNRKINQVIATVKLDGETPVRTDSLATLEPQGLTGLVFIQITPGKVESAMLTMRTPGFEYPVIKADESTLDKLLEGSGSVIERTVEALNRVNKLLSDKNIQAFSNTMTNIEAVSNDIKAREKLIDDAQLAIVSAGKAADAVTRLADATTTMIDTTAPSTFAKIEEASEKLGVASDEVAKLSQELAKPTQQVSQSTLPKLEEAIDNLNEAARTLTQLTDEANASPQALITKSKPKERKVNP